MRKKLLKRFLAIFIAVTILVGIIPVSSYFATEIEASAASDSGQGNVIQQAAVSYDLSNGAYLLSGTYIVYDAEGNVVEVDGEQPTLTEPGDYTILTTANNITYSRFVSLYYIGDTNLNGASWEEADLSLLEEMLNGVSVKYRADSAAEYAADVDNDEAVGTKDLELMQVIVQNDDIDSVFRRLSLADFGISEEETIKASSYSNSTKSWTATEDELLHEVEIVGIFNFSSEYATSYFSGEKGQTVLYIGNTSEYGLAVEAKPADKCINLKYKQSSSSQEFSTVLSITESELNEKGMNLFDTDIIMSFKFQFVNPDATDSTDANVVVTISDSKDWEKVHVETGTMLSMNLNNLQQSIYCKTTLKSGVTLENIEVEKTTTAYKVLSKYHVPAETYDYLGGDEVMPIVGFYGPYYGPLENDKYYNFLTDDIYQLVKDCGINLINYTWNSVGDI